MFFEESERLDTMEVKGKEGAEFDQGALDKYDRMLADDKLAFEDGEVAEDSENNKDDGTLNDCQSMDKYDKILKDSERENISSSAGNSVDVKEQKICYYDDNGKLYRSGNELMPNNEYEINGYRYKTSDNGSIISAEGTLHLKDREGRLQIKDSIEDIGKGDEREGDDRGHLIGDQFDGSNGLENMIPQDAAINRNDFKNFENELARMVKYGEVVEYKVEPVYENGSRRPTVIVVTYSIEGEENVRIFPNGEEK